MWNWSIIQCCKDQNNKTAVLYSTELFKYQQKVKEEQENNGHVNEANSVTVL